MLKIERSTDTNVVFTVSGRLEPRTVEELSTLLAAEKAASALVLDLKDLLLADREAVRKLFDEANRAKSSCK